MRRDRSMEELRASADQFTATINLGSSRAFVRENWPVPFFNRPEVVEGVLTPGATRRLMGNLLPPPPSSYPTFAWLKKPGRGGSGNRVVKLTEMVSRLNPEWDVQQHITGQHFRVITVGHKCVQSHIRRDSELDDERLYEWVGLGGTPNAVKQHARNAAALLDNQYSVIGWDIVFDGERPFILEGNSCPGINFATAERIWNTMRELINA